MLRNEAKEVMENELRCVQWASTGACDRDCAKCPLLRDTSDIMQAYRYVIKVLEEDVPRGAYEQVRWEMSLLSSSKNLDMVLARKLEKTRWLT